MYVYTHNIVNMIHFMTVIIMWCDMGGDNILFKYLCNMILFAIFGYNREIMSFL